MRLLTAAWGASLTALVLAGCGSPPVFYPSSSGNDAAAQTMPQQSTAVIAGTVSRGPVTPNQPAGHPGAAPVPNARIDVATPDGTAVTSTQTDAQGNFRIAMPPGTYRITTASGRSKDLPATVAISPGEEKRLDITIDTGLY